jgi:hypothetical protein
VWCQNQETGGRLCTQWGYKPEGRHMLTLFLSLYSVYIGSSLRKLSSKVSTWGYKVQCFYERNLFSPHFFWKHLGLNSDYLEECHFIIYKLFYSIQLWSF